MQSVLDSLEEMDYESSMPRSARLDAPGILHHFMGRGIERGKIFRDGTHREDFLKRLADLSLNPEENGKGNGHDSGGKRYDFGSAVKDNGKTKLIFQFLLTAPQI